MIDEGYIKYRARWTRAPAPSFPEIAELCRWRTRLVDAGLIGEYESLGVGFGNLSARVNGDAAEFLISGTQTGGQAASHPDQFCRVTAVDVAANTVDCSGPVQASSEAMTHAALYAADPRIGAVVHVHSARLWHVALTCMPSTAPEIAYGTPAMARELEGLIADPVFKRRGIAAMAGHEEGLIAVGADVAEAAQRILDFDTARD